MLTVLTTGLTGVGEQGAGVIFDASNNSALFNLLQAGGLDDPDGDLFNVI